MKCRLAIIVIAGFISSCSAKGFHGSSVGPVKILIGSGFNEEMRVAAVLNDQESIRRFLENYSFGSERSYSVKHPLSGYYEFHFKTGRIARMRFEDRTMRYEKKEYLLSKKTARILKKYLTETPSGNEP